MTPPDERADLVRRMLDDLPPDAGALRRSLIIEDAIRAAVEEEREACATVALEDTARAIAAAIRARGRP